MCKCEEITRMWNSLDEDAQCLYARVPLQFKLVRRHFDPYDEVWCWILECKNCGERIEVPFGE